MQGSGAKPAPVQLPEPEVLPSPAPTPTISKAARRKTLLPQKDQAAAIKAHFVKLGAPAQSEWAGTRGAPGVVNKIAGFVGG